VYSESELDYSSDGLAHTLGARLVVEDGFSDSASWRVSKFSVSLDGEVVQCQSAPSKMSRKLVHHGAEWCIRVCQSVHPVHTAKRTDS